jgi:hypothetical protein
MIKRAQGGSERLFGDNLWKQTRTLPLKKRFIICLQTFYVISSRNGDS